MFWVDNLYDKCGLCSHTGKLLKSMKTGKCICPKCVEYLIEASTEPDLIEELQESMAAMHQAIEIPITDSPTEE